MGVVGHGRWRLAGQCGELCTQRGVGCQHPVIAVTVQARGRDQCGQPLDQFQGREAQFGTPIGLGLIEAIDELVVTELLEPLQGEGRAGTITQQALQAGVVLAFDPDRGIDREASTMVPAGHLVGIVLPEITGAGEPAQHASAHLLLDCGEIL